MHPQPIYLTAEGLEKIKAEMHHLKTTVRIELAERLQKAKELGDLRENADYQEAKDEMGRMESRILELEDAVRRAEIIKADGADTVALGAKVTVTAGGKEKVYTIVGSTEADPLKGVISNESPLGRALMGRKVGETAEVKLPAGAVVYTVTKIA